MEQENATRGDPADGQKISYMILKGKKPGSLEIFLCLMANKCVAGIR